MPTTVLAERVGWPGRRPRENVARIRPEYAPADPADRISYEPGDQAQCDLWFPEVRIPVGAGNPRILPVPVMVSSHSRFIMARMMPSRMTGDLLDVMWELLGGLGAVPRRLIRDNETGRGRRNSFAAGVPAFAGVLATRIVHGKPYDPESKGVVERTNQFLETSFLPGRSFASPERTSTPNSRSGCPKPTPGWSAGLVPGPRSCSLRTRRRCWDCRRFRR